MTSSFLERAPFFRHVRLTESFKYKESSVLSGQIDTVASIDDKLYSLYNIDYT